MLAVVMGVFFLLVTGFIMLTPEGNTFSKKIAVNIAMIACVLIYIGFVKWLLLLLVGVGMLLFAVPIIIAVFERR